MVLKGYVLDFFLKLCLADTLARYNDIAFAGDYLSISTTDAWTMAFGFGLQIYFDFSAYSHMAIGISEILGLSIRKTFASLSFYIFFRVLA